jgi:hypothetical protein
VGRTSEKPGAVADQYNGNNIDGGIIPLQTAVSKKDEISRLYNRISSRQNCLCILVNNAEISGVTFQQAM